MLTYFFESSNGEIDVVSAFPLIDAKGEVLGAFAYEMESVKIFAEKSKILLSEIKYLKESENKK